MKSLRIICFLTLLSTLVASCAESPETQQQEDKHSKVNVDRDGRTKLSDIPKEKIKQKNTITAGDGTKFYAVDIEDDNGNKKTLYFDEDEKQVSISEEDMKKLIPPSPLHIQKILKKF